MSKLFSILLLLGGIVLIIYGMSVDDSSKSGISRFFAGAPSGDSIWLTVGGIASAAIGVSGLVVDSDSS